MIFVGRRHAYFFGVRLRCVLLVVAGSSCLAVEAAGRTGGRWIVIWSSTGGVQSCCAGSGFSRRPWSSMAQVDAMDGVTVLATLDPMTCEVDMECVAKSSERAGGERPGWSQHLSVDRAESTSHNATVPLQHPPNTAPLFIITIVQTIEE
jgi:hypothetical protein